MLLPRVVSALRGTTPSIAAAFAPRPVLTSSTALTPFLQRQQPSGILSQVRWATHKTSGRANKGKDGPGKRLGAKKTAGEKVHTGMILYRQRGTLWYPGENCGMGRDHTIFAMTAGEVRYYKDPAHPKRKFIGVALSSDHVLPKPLNAARRRRLGKVEAPLEEKPPKVAPGTPLKTEDLKMNDGFYMFRPPNWRIGKVMPKVEVKNNNPFARWRKRTKRVKNAKLRRGIR